MPQLGVLIPILSLLIGGFVIFSKSEIGKALATRIAGGSRDLEHELHSLRDEVASLRAELGETQERLDFTERMLAGSRKDS
jgi:hypothetical protein